ncbi:MAG: ion channel [Armatimonadota bacterium]
MVDAEKQELQIGAMPFTEEADAALQAMQAWKNRLLDFAVDNPTEALLAVLTGGAMVFYLAERGANERVQSYADALHYIATCFSVGYANLFPQTTIGKVVAATVMSIGPSLASWQLEGRLVRRAADAADAASPPVRPDFAPVVDKLDAILQELQAQNRTAPEAPAK